MGVKPLYIVKLGEGYYASGQAWKQVPREEASRMIHKDARRVASYLKQSRIGYHTSVEPLVKP